MSREVSKPRDSGFELFSMALKLDKHIDSSAVEMTVKFKSDTISITSNLTQSLASIFDGHMSYRLATRGRGPGGCRGNQYVFVLISL